MKTPYILGKKPAEKKTSWGVIDHRGYTSLIHSLARSLHSLNPFTPFTPYLSACACVRVCVCVCVRVCVRVRACVRLTRHHMILI